MVLKKLTGNRMTVIVAMAMEKGIYARHAKAKATIIVKFF